jgi:hypothetical protein
MSDRKDGNDISGIREQIYGKSSTNYDILIAQTLMQNIANAAVAFLSVVTPRTGSEEKGRFDIVVRRCGQEVQAYLTCGERNSCAVLVVAKSATTIHQAMMGLMLDVGDLATKEVVSARNGGPWAAKPGQEPILKKAFEEGGQYKNPYHCGH